MIDILKIAFLKLYKKYKSIKIYVQDQLLYVFTTLNAPYYTGFILRFCVSEFYTSNTTIYSPDYRVLILEKSGFKKDVHAIFSLSDNVEVFKLRRGAVKRIASVFLSSEIDDNYYSTDNKIFENDKIRYRAFLKKMWQGFDPKSEIDLVLSGNFGYYAERELASALELIGIPFIVVHKENLKSPGRVKFWEDIYKKRRGPFTGRKILVYNKIERDLLIRSNVVDESKVEVIGMPRLDQVLNWRINNAGSIPSLQVMFFSFLPYYGMPIINRKGAGYDDSYIEVFNEDAYSVHLSDLCHSFHRSIVSLSKENPEIQFILKTKGRAREKVEIAKMLEVENFDFLPENLKLIHGGSPLEYVYSSSVICGLNSTAILEAIAAGKDVIVPEYHEATNPNVKPFIADMGQAVITVKSENEFKRKIIETVYKRKSVPKYLTSNSMEILQYWLGNNDGSSSVKATNSIFTEINR